MFFILCTVLHEISGRLDLSVHALLLCNSASVHLGYAANMTLPASLSSLESGFNMRHQYAPPIFQVILEKKTSSLDLPLSLWRAVHMLIPDIAIQVLSIGRPTS